MNPLEIALAVVVIAWLTTSGLAYRHIRSLQKGILDSHNASHKCWLYWANKVSSCGKKVSWKRHDTNKLMQKAAKLEGEGKG